jgi:hypothetical protein
MTAYRLSAGSTSRRNARRPVRLPTAIPPRYSPSAVRDPVPHRRRRARPRHLLLHSNLCHVRGGVQVPGDRCGDSDELSETVLPPEYLHGLPPC